MADVKQIFGEAYQAYKETIKEVAMIGTTLEEYYKSKGQEFSCEILLRQFDCILQYSLLEYALLDGEATGEEVAFIKEMTDYADLVSFINSKYTTDVSWEAIAGAGYDAVKSWVDRNKKFIDVIAAEFENAFALVDASVTNVDILDKVIKQIARIVACLFAIDGDNSEDCKGYNYIKQVIGNIQRKMSR